MVRKNAAAEASSPSRRLASDNQHNDNEKRSKLKRHKSSNFNKAGIVICLSILAIVCIMAMFRDNPKVQKYTPSRLRKSARHLQKGEDDDQLVVKNPLTGEAADFLPPNSIYKLSIPDIHENLIDLSKFRGMVTLVVNVACL